MDVCIRISLIFDLQHLIGKDNQGTSLVHKRFRFPQGLKTVLNFTLRRLSTEVSVPLPRRSLYVTRSSVVAVCRFVMKSGAKGCEIIVCGKLRAALRIPVRKRARVDEISAGYALGVCSPWQGGANRSGQAVD
ncbi:hypothetical protein Bca101_060368 [Brassica carinata]